MNRAITDTCLRARQALGPDFPRTGSVDDGAYTHIRACSPCNHFYAWQRRIANRSWSAARRNPTPDDLRERILHRLGGAPVRSQIPARNASIVAFLAASATAAFVFFLPGERPVSPSAAVDEFLARLPHATEAVANSNPAALEDWLAARVGYRFTVPDIPDAHLVGGRVALLSGGPAAAVSYQVHDRELTYLMVPRRDLVHRIAPNTTASFRLSSQLTIVLWEERGTARGLVSDLPDATIQQIVDHCRSKQRPVA